jgi:hypothetical protein
MHSIRPFAGPQVEQPPIDAQERGKLFDHEPPVRHCPTAGADTLLALRRNGASRKTGEGGSAQPLKRPPLRL